MIKRIAAPLALLLTVACGSTSMQSSSATTGGSAPAGITTNAANAPNYILLSQPTQVRDFGFSDPIYDFHIRGTMTNKGFYPAGGVQGHGKLCSNGQDWLQLGDLTVHKAGQGTPTAPYLMGCASASGFQPSSRDVVMQ